MKIYRWRLVVIGILFALPIVVLIAMGGWYLWTIGWMYWATWPMIACFALAFFLAWRWQARQQLLGMDFTPEMHWTDRDKQAWQLVEARAKGVAKIEPEKLSDMHFYMDTAKDMALELAQVYHPKTKDPVSSLTIPEILAVVELASHDLGDMVRKYLPAGHLLTINDWQRARQATKWYGVASNVYWAVSAVFAPYATATRYLASRIGISAPLQMLQQNLILWFYTAYIHRLGTYLIDLNSGRLRVGAERYRELMDEFSEKETDAAKAAEDGSPAAARDVTITVMGQVKAGKSSLINALLGEQKAITSVLPATDKITRYQVKPDGFANQLTLLDTEGYANEGPSKDQLQETQTAARDSDLILLVLHATNPGRQADVKFIAKLAEWFENNANLKMPPVLAVVTHIDLLSPKMEWAPPYDWQNPTRPKEKNIAGAVAGLREQFESHLVGAVPMCTAEGKVYGVHEELTPALARLLGESRAVALLRCLHAEASEGKFQMVFDQALAGGKELAKALWQQVSSQYK